MVKKTIEVSWPPGPRRLGSLTLVRVPVYYVVAGAFLLLLTALFPQGALRPAAAPPTGMEEGLDWLRWHMGLFPSGAPRWVDACVQMVAALILVLPIAFTYIRTRTRLKYDHSLVQTVVVLPIVVTAILVVVQDSLALAFSLAGIVAAVRFRNNLRESGDAVYIFGSIGIGFASGIHAIAVAMALSIFFVVVELALWKLNLGSEFDDTFSRLCLPSGADLAAPPHSAGDVPVAPPETSRKRPDESLGADPRMVVLKIYVSEPQTARPVIERVLTRDAKQWAAIGTPAGNGDPGVLEYRVRPRKSIGIDVLRDTLVTEGAPQVIATDETESTSQT